jgi:ADP-ribose pyrophosphatase
VPGFRKGPEREIHRGRIIQVTEGTFFAPDGSELHRDLVHHPGAVGVVPLHDDDTVTLIRQYRAAVDEDLLEIPAGLCDVVGESLEATAGRELAEEVGLAAGRLERLCEFYNSAGFCDELTHVFLATDLRAVDRGHQSVEEEHAVVEVVALADVPELIESARIRDAKTVVGLTLVLTRPGSRAG